MTDDEFIAELEKMGRAAPAFAGLAAECRKPGGMDRLLRQMLPAIMSLRTDPQARAAMEAGDPVKLAEARNRRRRRWGVRP